MIVIIEGGYVHGKAIPQGIIKYIVKTFKLNLNRYIVAVAEKGIRFET